MSVNAVIQIKFGSPVSPQALVSSLFEAGWRPERESSISVLRSEDLNVGEWSDIGLEGSGGFAQWIEGIRSPGYGCGFVLYFPGAEIGGSFIISSDWLQVHWSISINRPVLSGFPRITDFSACLEVVVPAISSLMRSVQSIECFQDF
jgi:hypothetical protein